VIKDKTKTWCEQIHDVVAHTFCKFWAKEKVITVIYYFTKKITL